jgi:thioredoxin-related protein
MHKKYLKNINFEHHREKIEDIIDMLMCEAKDKEEKLYNHIEMELYELAYGKKISEEMAEHWVQKMKPNGKHWNIDETNNAMYSLGYNLDQIDFFVVSNMIYNDYYNLVKENEELALKMAEDWLKDTDAKDDKLYNYWKYIVKK